MHLTGESAIFCYYSSFAQNRQGLGKFLPEDIDPNLCTHVIFAFADVIKGKYLKPSSWNDIPNGKDKGISRIVMESFVQWYCLSYPLEMIWLKFGGDAVHHGWFWAFLSITQVVMKYLSKDMHRVSYNHNKNSDKHTNLVDQR